MRVVVLPCALLASAFAQPGVPAPSELSPPNPLTLEQAIQEALANNLELAAEKYNVTVAEAREITARLRPNPLLTINGQTLNVLGANYNLNNGLGPNQMNVHTDFPVERGHKRQERMALAGAERTLAELGVREVMRQVIYNVQSAYVDVQEAKANVRLAQQNLESLQGVVGVNRARLASGDLAAVELERSEIAALQFQTAVDQAQLQLDQSKTQLQVYLGRRRRDPDLDVTETFRNDTLPDSQPEIAREALAWRPDYLAYRQEQVRSQADLRLQLANGKVDYNVGTEFTRQSAYGIPGNSMGVYFSVPLPIFNRNQGEIARAQYEISQAATRLSAMEMGVDADIEKAYREYQVSRMLLQNVETNMLAKAREVRDTTEYSYRRGEAALVEFLDAQRAFNDTMQTYNAARANYARSLFKIDSVSGKSVNGQP